MDISADELISELRTQISDLSLQLAIANLQLRKLQSEPVQTPSSQSTVEVGPVRPSTPPDPSTVD